MFDFSWSELGLIAVVALLVIGPKDLPRVMRILGQWMGRARAIAREFQGSLDQMMHEAELDDIKHNIDRATHFDLNREIRNTIDPKGEIERSFTDPTLLNPLADTSKPADEDKPAEAEKPAAALPPPEDLPPLAEPPPVTEETRSSAPEPEPHDR